MWGLAIKLGIWLLGRFFPAKDERDVERQAGEDLGRAKAGQAAAEGQLHAIDQADTARRAVVDDADAILHDPANLGASTRPRAE